MQPCRWITNWTENQIRPIVIGRNNWLFAGSLRAGKRADAVMSLIQSYCAPCPVTAESSGK